MRITNYLPYLLIIWTCYSRRVPSRMKQCSAPLSFLILTKKERLIMGRLWMIACSVINNKIRMAFLLMMEYIYVCWNEGSREDWDVGCCMELLEDVCCMTIAVMRVCRWFWVGCVFLGYLVGATASWCGRLNLSFWLMDDPLSARMKCYLSCDCSSAVAIGSTLSPSKQPLKGLYIIQKRVRWPEEEK
jgi:hypothetical protein